MLEPESVNWKFAPVLTVGRATVETKVPSGVNSSRNTGAALPESVPVPLPTRQTTILPGVNASALIPVSFVLLPAKGDKPVRLMASPGPSHTSARYHSFPRWAIRLVASTQIQTKGVRIRIINSAKLLFSVN